MESGCPCRIWAFIVLTTISTFFFEASGTTFTFLNSCPYTVWPGVLSNAGSSMLANGGFQLGSGQSMNLVAPAGWSGRFWGRTGCIFSTSGQGTCLSGDCGGNLQCSGAGAATPATLAEFSIASTQSSMKQDFYDVSLVDGYNIPIAIVAVGGSGTCGTAGCGSNLNLNCPSDLQVLAQGDVVGCKSACDAFQSAQYCCQAAYANPSTCKPTNYSELFKAACPKAYSYAFDDPTSTFTCTGADYSIIFCQSSSSQKSTTGSLQEPGSNIVGPQLVYESSGTAPSVRSWGVMVWATLLGMAMVYRTTGRD